MQTLKLVQGKKVFEEVFIFKLMGNRGLFVSGLPDKNFMIQS